MSARHPTEKERARQAERLRAMKATPPARPPKKPPTKTDADGESLRANQREPLSAGRLYSPDTLQSAMQIGRSYYESLLRAGMPGRKIAGRYWFSGTLVLAWVEGRSDGQAGER